MRRIFARLGVFILTNQVVKSHIAIVTGAVGGMGSACVKALLADGWRNFILCDMDESRLTDACENLIQAGASAQFLTGDVSAADWPSQLMDLLGEQKIGTLVHTAGLSPNMAGPERIFEVNLDACYRLLDAAIEHVAQGSSVILYSSNSSYMPIIAEADAAFEQPLGADLTVPLRHYAPVSEAAYPMSKRGVRTLTRHRAKDFGSRGCRLLSLSPGAIDTAMVRLELESSERARAMIERSAMGRLGLAEEVAGVTTYLASPAAAYIAGCDILVDGGQLAGIGLGGKS